MSTYLVYENKIQSVNQFKLLVLADTLTLIAEHFEDEPIAETFEAVTEAFKDIDQYVPLLEFFRENCPAVAFEINESGYCRQVDALPAILEDEAEGDVDSQTIGVAA